MIKNRGYGETIWDGYADWAESAEKDNIRDLQTKITGTGNWHPNYVSPSFQFACEALVAINRINYDKVTVLDFGCGLGRNASVLRSFFPRVIALDLPEMIVRLKAEHLDNLYDSVYDNLDGIKNETVNVVYDSVVWQHIVSIPYVTELVNRLVEIPSLNAVVSLTNQSVNSLPLRLLMENHGWKKVLSDTETQTFGSPHNLTVLRR